MADGINRTAIFMDFDNLCITLERFYEKKSTPDIKSLAIQKIIDSFGSDEIITVKAYADFQKISADLTSLQRYQVELRHVYSCGSGQRKNASDIALAIDVIKSLYTKNFINDYVLVSSDSDMLPILNEIRYFSKNAIVIYSEYCSTEDPFHSVKDKRSLESLLGISAYKDIVPERLTADEWNGIFNCINSLFWRLKVKFGGKGTTGSKDIAEAIFSMDKYVRNDASIIQEYLEKKGALVKQQLASSRYQAWALSDEYITRNGILLSENVFKLSDITVAATTK